MLPEILKKFDMFVDGGSFLGRVDEVTLPKIEKKMEEFQAAGMLGDVDIDMGYSKMTMGFTCRENTPAIFKLLGQVDMAGVGLRFVGAYRADGPGSPVVKQEIIARGRLATLDLGTANQKNLTELKPEFSLTYFKFVRNGETIIELDFINMIENVGGVDLYKDIRAALEI